MFKIFNSIEEIKKYYNRITNTYNCRRRKLKEQIILNFDLNVESNIIARVISAPSISVKNIIAWNITAWEINACDIDSNYINAGVIRARDIKGAIQAMDIYARDIDAYGIDAVNIYARDIVYNATCRTYEDFKCNSIKCTQSNPSHYTKYGKLEVRENGK